MLSANVKRRRALAARRERLVRRQGYLHSLLDWVPPLSLTGGWTLDPDVRRILQRWLLRPRMNPNLPDPERLREAARDLAGQGLSDRDVDEALRLPPGWSAGLLAETAGKPSTGD